MRYRFIENRRRPGRSPSYVAFCAYPSGYDDWTTRGLSRRVGSNRALDKISGYARSGHRQRYGAPRIADALHDAGIECSKNRIVRSMCILKHPHRISHHFAICDRTESMGEPHGMTDNLGGKVLTLIAGCSLVHAAQSANPKLN
jgi:hypothetical protein